MHGESEQDLVGGADSRVGMAEVAARAGVAVSTVSRVLSDKPLAAKISTATAERVRQAARELGYLSSGAGRALRLGTSRCIGIYSNRARQFVDMLHYGSYAAHAMAGLVEVASQRGYHVTVMTGLPAAEPTPHLPMADGFLVLNGDFGETDAQLDLLVAAQRPMVFTADRPEGLIAPLFRPDDSQGGALAAEQLAALGCRRVLFLAGQGYRPIFQRRADGAAAYLADLDLALVRLLDWQGSLDELPEHDGLITGNDAILRQVVRLMHELGRPTLPMVGLGHERQEVSGGLTLTHPVSDLSRAAMQCLIDQIEGRYRGDPGAVSTCAFVRDPGDPLP